MRAHHSSGQSSPVASFRFPFHFHISCAHFCSVLHFRRADFIAYSHAADYNNPDGMDYAVGYKEAQKALEMS